MDILGIFKNILVKWVIIKTYEIIMIFFFWKKIKSITLTFYIYARTMNLYAS